MKHRPAQPNSNATAQLTLGRELPGPRPQRWLGSRGNLVRFGRDIIGYASELFGNFGELVSIVGGDLDRRPPLTRWVLVRGVDLYREVATRPEDFHKPPLNKQLSPRGDHLTERQRALKRWGAGLFNLNGEAHKEHRRILMPAFHRERIARYCAEIAAMTDETIRAWQPESVVNVRDEMQALTLRIVARCLLGQEQLEQDDESVGALVQQALKLAISPSVFLFPIDRPGTPYHRFLNVVQRMDRLVQGVIDRKRRAGGGGDDLLSMLFDAQDGDGQPLTDDYLIEHTGVMFIAGHETTSNALMWTLLLLSQHPRVAADLLDELEGRLRGSAPTMEQMDDLPFLDAVIRESMRILPPVPMNARVVARETTLQGYRLPAGTQLLVSFFHNHRAPDVFDHPNRFDPYRWENCKPSAYEFSPFGTGVRTCIGAPFALAELKIALPLIMQRFRLELLPGIRVDRAARITLSARGGLPVRVTKQDRQFAQGSGTLTGNVREMIELDA